MMKKILKGAGALVVLAVVLVAYNLYMGTKKSPKGTASFSQNGLDVAVTYNRPFKKNRLIFGEKQAGALVPYGKYWRLGANAATEITFSKNALFAGKPVNAGSYRMYAVPGESTWKVVLNSQLGKWGAREADHDQDVLTVEVPVQAAPSEVEQLTVSFSAAPTGGTMDLAWDKTLVRVPVAAN
jgi:hypothetical protein